MTPIVGSVIQVYVNPGVNNGSNIAAAVVTRVWSQDGTDQRWTINYRLMRDGFPSPDDWRTSAYLHADQAAADTFIAAAADAQAPTAGQPAGAIVDQLQKSGSHSFFPPQE